MTGLDCFTDYYDSRLKRRNLAELPDGTVTGLFEADIAEADLQAYVDDADIIFHLAAQPGVRASWSDGFPAYVRNNVSATQRLLECCRKSIPRCVVIASSSSVYGDAAQLPTSEAAPCVPISPYGATKLLTENLAYAYWRNYKVPTVRLRYFTVYGPRQRPDMAFARLIKAGLGRETFTVFGDGEQTRDFTFVHDAVDATVSAALAGTPGDVYNIGGGSRVAMNEVFEIVEQVLGRPLDIRHEATSPGDARHTGADTSKAAVELDYVPKRPLSAGLKAHVAWFKELIGVHGSRPDTARALRR